MADLRLISWRCGWSYEGKLLSVRCVYEDVGSHRCFICLMFRGHLRQAFSDNEPANAPLERLLGVSGNRLQVSSFRATLVFHAIMVLFGEGSHGGERNRSAREKCSSKLGGRGTKEPSRSLYKAGPMKNWRHPY